VEGVYEVSNHSSHKARHKPSSYSPWMRLSVVLIVAAKLSPIAKIWNKIVTENGAQRVVKSVYYYRWNGHSHWSRLTKKYRDQVYISPK
jgi:hypothetical protein